MADQFKPGPKPPAPKIIQPSPAAAQPTPAKSTAAPVTIRTMSDDLATAKQQPTPPRPPAATAPTTAGRAFPLPPTGGSQPPAAPATPRPRRRRRIGLFVLLTLIGLTVLGASGALAWWFTNQQPAAPTETPVAEPVVAGNTEVLPSNTAATLHYRVADTTSRSSLMSAWNTQPAPADRTTLLSGDPRLLLAEADITEFIYVILPQEPRPYLVTPKNSATERLLTNTPDAQTVEFDGWLIAHAVDRQGYLQALAAGSQAEENSQPPTPTPAPLELTLGANGIRRVRQNVLTADITDGQLQSARLSLTPTTNGIVTVSGTGDVLRAPQNGTTDQALLDLLPSTAGTTHLGSNFSADLSRWQDVANSLDQGALDAATVQALLTDLATPYAFYIDQTITANPTIAAAIELPTTTTIVLGDPAVEQALAALVPLLTGRPSIAPVAFNDGEYASTALRFANLDGATTALDYALTDTHLLIATSKDAMFALIDSATGTASTTLADNSTQQGLRAATPTAATTQAVVGQVSAPFLRQLFPIAEAIPFALSINPGVTPDSVTITGSARISTTTTANTPTPSPAATIAPTPTTQADSSELITALAQAFGIDPETATAEAAATSSITIANSAFTPQMAVVTTGTAVTWTNNDTIDHTITSDGTITTIGDSAEAVTGPLPPADLFDSSTLTPGTTFTHTFTTPGAYTYASQSQNNLAGAVIVLEP